MHGSFSSISLLINGLIAQENSSLAQIVVFPPYVYLQKVRELLQENAIAYGAQNVYPEASGAFTGEIAGPMLQDLGCKYVLIGHSERRHLLGEKDDFIARKFKHVKECGMMPVLCVGETAQERETGETKNVLLRQISTAIELSRESFKQSIIAYEPVWAIGTGKVADAKQIQEAHGFIRSSIAKYDTTTAENISILYGGSVTPESARALFTLDNVDGALVGGASLDKERFLGIAKCIN